MTAYGYRCPGGAVRTLCILYQENMIGAPTDEPGRGLIIHPDAILTYNMVYLRGIKLTNTPKEGHEHVQRPPSPKKQSLWKKTIGKFF